MKFQRVIGSLATRIILVGIVFVALGTLARTLVLTQYLREDVGAVMATQQLTLANYVARDIDQNILERQKLLQQMAATLPLDQLNHPAQLREWLGSRHALQSSFSDGFVVTTTNGQVVADYPERPERAGLDYGDHDYIRVARDGVIAIGAPAVDPVIQKPILPMAVPVRDASGKVQAILIGTTALDATGFLSFAPNDRVGEGGSFLLISPRDRLFVASTDPAMVLKPTPADGVNPLHDRAMQGYRGTGITVNAQGVEEISAVASVPSTGWFVVARIPSSEAFAVIGRTQQYVAKNTFLSMVVFLLITGGFLIYVFRPLLHAADHADRMTRGEVPLEPLKVVRQDEVGHLTEAFNRLLEKLQASQAKMEHMAHHDVLTGLPNRALLNDRLTQALARASRNQTQLALLYVDLDRFKPINDLLGHEAGDAALMQIAQRLTEVVRESDTLARVGGDEFVLLLTDLQGSGEHAKAAASAVATKCLDAIAKPITLHGDQHTIGASIGIALGDGTVSPQDLQVAADSAMYKAKQAGGQRSYCIPARPAIASA